MGTLTVIGLLPAHSLPLIGRGDQDALDLARPLSPKGLFGAGKLNGILRNRKLRADMVLSSPAMRAIQTAAFTTGFRQENLIRLESLYVPGNQTGKILEILNKKLGVTAAYDYLKHPLSGGSPQTYGLFAGEAILEQLHTHYGVNFLSRDLTVVIAGHRVLTQLAVAGLLRCLPAADEAVLDFLYGDMTTKAAAFEVVVHEEPGELVASTDFRLLA